MMIQKYIPIDTKNYLLFIIYFKELTTKFDHETKCKDEEIKTLKRTLISRDRTIETLRIKKQKRKFIRKQKQENNWANLTGKVFELDRKGDVQLRLK